MNDYWWGFIAILFYIPFLFLWGFTLVDVFMRKDLHAWSKMLWALFVLFVPLIGVLVYFISRPKEYDTFDSTAPYAYGAPGYQPAVAQNAQDMRQPSDMDAIIHMHDEGKLSDSEYESIRQRLSPA
jgi:hypothetical protein